MGGRALGERRGVFRGERGEERGGKGVWAGEGPGWVVGFWLWDVLLCGGDSGSGNSLHPANACATAPHTRECTPPAVHHTHTHTHALVFTNTHTHTHTRMHCPAAQEEPTPRFLAPELLELEPLQVGAWGWGLGAGGGGGSHPWDGVYQI